MSVTYSFQRDEPVGVAVRRIGLELLDSIQSDLGHVDSNRDECVHSARQQLKKLRGLLRLVRQSLDRGVYTRENAYFRDVGRSLAEAREAAAALECLDTLFAHYSERVPRSEFQNIERELRRLHESRLSRAREAAVVERAVLELKGARERMIEWPLIEDDFESLAKGFRDTYRGARRALDESSREPSSEHFHELRKLSKYHLHHIRLLEPAFPIELRARRKALDALNDALGHLHDLDLLRQTLGDERLATAPEIPLLALTALVDRRREELKADAAMQAARLYTEKPKALVKRVRSYFDLWRAPAEIAPPAAEPDAGREQQAAPPALATPELTKAARPPPA